MAETDFVTLESEDGFTFAVPRKIALASGTLKAMLDEDAYKEYIHQLTSAAFQEAENKKVKLNYRGIIVLKVIEYLAFKAQYADFPASDIREDFADRIDPYIALELLTAADYLDT